MNVFRKYTQREIAEASLFWVGVQCSMEPVGEECGTLYDMQAFCPQCGGGSKRNSNLILDLRRTPKHKNIIGTLADEWIINQEFAELIVHHKISGCSLSPVQHKPNIESDEWSLTDSQTGRQLIKMAKEKGIEEPWEQQVWALSHDNIDLFQKAKEEFVEKRMASVKLRNVPPWYEFRIDSNRVQIDSRTKFGADFFDDDENGKYRCSKAGQLNHVIGAARLSELYIDKNSYDGSDIALTAQLEGVKRGFLRPAPLIVISKRFFSLIKEHGLRGITFEIAHLV